MGRDDLAKRVIHEVHKRLILDLNLMTLLNKFYEEEAKKELRVIQWTDTSVMKNCLILQAVGKGGWTKYEAFKECLKSDQAHLVEYLHQLEQQFREDKPSSLPTTYVQAMPYIPQIDRVPNEQEIQCTCIGSTIGLGWKFLGSDGYGPEVLKQSVGVNTDEAVTGLSHDLGSVQIDSKAGGGGKRREDALETSSEGSNSGHVPKHLKPTVIAQETLAPPSGPIVTAESHQQSPAQPTPGSSMTDSERFKKLFDRRDRRLVDMQKEDVEAVRKFCEGKPEKGEHGVVSFTKELPGLNIKVALKEVTTMDQNDEMKRRSVNCEKLVSRIMHFGICPLLGCWENSDQTLNALLYPYMEGGNLSRALEEDNNAVNMNQPGKVRMDHKVRLRILFQVAAAIEYLHTPVKHYRGTVLHRDVKTDNIVLDRKMNARLIDFGLSRELPPEQDTQTMTQTDMSGTIGSKSMNKTHDLYSFGVVMRQMLTGLTAKELKDQKSDFVEQNQIKAVWEHSPGFTKLLELSQKCINSQKVHGTPEETPLNLKQDILDIIHEIPNCPCWENDNNRCQLCMVNEPEPRAETLSGHTSNDCSSNGVRVCVPCMRNFYLNPIKCHSCDGNIRPPVGDGWGALLIAGNDTDIPFANSFTEEILKLRQIFVSKCPPVTCMEEDVVNAVVPSEPGTDCIMQIDVDKALKRLSDSNIDKLILVFCGHYVEKEGFRLGSDTEYMSEGSLTKKLSSMKDTNHFVLFLDCCNPPNISIIDKQVLQLNACSSNDKISNNIFTKFIQQALIRKAMKERCLNAKYGREDCDECKGLSADFIDLLSLYRYVENHYKEHEKLPKPEIKIRELSSYVSAIIAFGYDFEVFVKLTVCKADKTREEITVYPAKYKDIKSLKTMILRDVINKDEQLWSGLDSDKHSDIVSLVYRYGLRPENVEELDTMEKLMAAWNAKVGSLEAKLRNGRMLKEGPVALYTNKFHPQAHLTDGQEMEYGVVEVKDDAIRINVTADYGDMFDHTQDEQNDLIHGILTDDAKGFTLSQASSSSEMSDTQITGIPQGELATDDVDVTALGADLRSDVGSMGEPEGNQAQPQVVRPDELVENCVILHFENN